MSENLRYYFNANFVPGIFVKILLGGLGWGWGRGDGEGGEASLGAGGTEASNITAPITTGFWIFTVGLVRHFDFRAAKCEARAALRPALASCFAQAPTSLWSTMETFVIVRPHRSMTACPMVRLAPRNLGPCYARAPYTQLNHRIQK